MPAVFLAVACPPPPVCTDSRVLPSMSNAFIRFLTALSEAVGRPGLPFKSFAPSHTDRSQRGASRQYGPTPACHCQWRTVHRERYSLFAPFKGLAVRPLLGGRPGANTQASHTKIVLDTAVPWAGRAIRMLAIRSLPAGNFKSNPTCQSDRFWEDWHTTSAFFVPFARMLPAKASRAFWDAFALDGKSAADSPQAFSCQT